jgi:hypothetical protein
VFSRFLAAKVRYVTGATPPAGFIAQSVSSRDDSKALDRRSNSAGSANRSPTSPPYGVSKVARQGRPCAASIVHRFISWPAAAFASLLADTGRCSPQRQPVRRIFGSPPNEGPMHDRRINRTPEPLSARPRSPKTNANEASRHKRQFESRPDRPRSSSCYGTVVVPSDTDETAFRRLPDMIASNLIYAPAELRDRFLNALDAGDGTLCGQLALDLQNCMNPLPGMACQQVGLPVGSTYGSAARQILQSGGTAASSAEGGAGTGRP